MFRLTISERSKDPYGRALEILGSYNPHTKDLQAKGDRINYWLSQGAQMTPTVNNLLVDKKVVEGQKVKASKVGDSKKEDDKAVATDGEAPKTETEDAGEKPTEEVTKEETKETEAKSE